MAKYTFTHNFSKHYTVCDSIHLVINWHRNFGGIKCCMKGTSMQQESILVPNGYFFTRHRRIKNIRELLTSICDTKIKKVGVSARCTLKCSRKWVKPYSLCKGMRQVDYIGNHNGIVMIYTARKICTDYHLMYGDENKKHNLIYVGCITAIKCTYRAQI